MFFGKRFSGYKGGPFSGLNILVLSIIKNHEDKNDKDESGITGYDIIQEINKQFKSMWKASPGTIYPLLGRLEKRGFVSFEEIVDENNRQKKIYTITKLGKERLKEVLKDNLEPSMNTLGDYIRTVIQTWLPGERSARVMSCFPFHCTPPRRKIDEKDYTIENKYHVETILKDLEYSKEHLIHRLNELENQITKYQEILEKIQTVRDKNAKIIPVGDGSDEEFDNF